MTVKPNPPRRHHFIPEFYSRQWAVNCGRLVAFSAPVAGKLEVKLRYPSEVGWAWDLYATPGVEPDEAQRLELELFRVVDDAAAKALQVLLEPGLRVVPAKEAGAWSLFIMSLWHRTPAHLASVKRAGERLLQRIVADLPGRFPGDPKEAAEYVRTFNPEIAERALLRVLPDVMANRNIRDALHKLVWMMLDVPEDCPTLLLSDDPIARTAGIKIPTGHIAMPLSPRRLLIGVYEPAFAAQVLRGRPRDLAKGMNLWAVQGARHFVAAIDRRQEPFIRKHFGAMPKDGLLSGAH